MIVWWVLISIGIIMLVKWLIDPKGFHGGDSKAPDIRNECYARGEVDEQQYQKRKSDLGVLIQLNLAGAKPYCLDESETYDGWHRLGKTRTLVPYLLH